MFKEEGNKDPIYDDEYVHDDIPEVFEKEEKDEPLYDGECESLVTRRSLQTTMDKQESWIKHNILPTSNTSQGKVCDIIINSGSCESVVLNDMVENLWLKYCTRPCKYGPFKFWSLQNFLFFKIVPDPIFVMVCIRGT